MPTRKHLLYYTCSCCGETLPNNREHFAGFKEADKNGDGHRSTCRKCEYNKLVEENVKEENGIKLYKCFKCGQGLPIDNFQLSDGNSGHKYYYRDGLDKRCKKCKLTQMKKARSLYDTDACRHYLFIHRINGCKSRAKAKNLEFDLTLEYLEELGNKQNGICAISGIPMTLNVDKGRNPYNVSVDQINPSGGYTKDNIQLVCMCVNQLKSDFDMPIILNICKNILNNYTCDDT